MNFKNINAQLNEQVVIRKVAVNSTVETKDGPSKEKGGPKKENEKGKGKVRGREL